LPLRPLPESSPKFLWPLDGVLFKKPFNFDRADRSASKSLVVAMTTDGQAAVSEAKKMLNASGVRLACLAIALIASAMFF
jgi:hypothetical protein